MAVRLEAPGRGDRVITVGHGQNHGRDLLPPSLDSGLLNRHAQKAEIVGRGCDGTAWHDQVHRCD